MKKSSVRPYIMAQGMGTMSGPEERRGWYEGTSIAIWVLFPH